MRYVLSKSALAQNIKDETIILELDKGEYYELNAMASSMLRLLRKHGQTRQVIDAIEAEYDVSREELSADLDELIGHMQEAGLLKLL